MQSPPSVPAIVVVEDEPLIALDIEDALSGLGAPVHLARSLAEARTVLAAMPPPCLVLLDVVLPDGRSFDLAHELVAANVEIAFLTGYDHGIPDTLSAVTVIDKPFNTETIIALARRVLDGCD